MDSDLVRWLYSLPPGEFVTARNDALRQAESKDDAARIRGLRRPTVAAWAVNLLVADSPGDLDDLAGLGERLRVAQAEMRGGDLRELSAERKRTVAALVQRAAGLARDAGHPLASGAEREVETTLDAVAADPESADAVRAGTLTKALAYSGTGFAGSSSQVVTFRRAESRTETPTRTEPKAKTPARTKSEAPPGAKAEAPSRTESQSRREARRRAVEKAEQDLETAKRHRTQARDALDEARDRRESAAAERHRLRTELATAERVLARADDRVTKAADQVDAAESALNRARHRLTEAKAGRSGQDP